MSLVASSAGEGPDECITRVAERSPLALERELVMDWEEVMAMNEAEFAARALQKELEIRAQERAEAERIAMRIAHEKAQQAADLQREQMRQWRDQARG